MNDTSKKIFVAAQWVVLFAVVVSAAYYLTRPSRPVTPSAKERVRASGGQSEASWLVSQSVQLETDGHVEQALTVAKEAVKANDKNGNAWKQLGVLHARLQANDEAFKALKRASELKPNDNGIWRELGWAAWMVKDRELAVKAWDKAVRGATGNTDRLVVQIVGRIAEEGEDKRAVELHRAWRPDRTLLETGHELTAGGRTRAAEPFLLQAWDDGDRTPDLGLNLGYVRAMNSRFVGVDQYLEPFVSGSNSNRTDAQITMALDAFMQCGAASGIPPLMERLAAQIQDRPALTRRLTDIYYGMARDEADRKNATAAMDLFSKALERDPNRADWVQAWQTANQMGQADAGLAMIIRVQSQTTSDVVRLAIDGKRAELKGDYVKASDAYRESLKLQAEQPELHSYLFQVAMKLGDLDVARQEADWTAARVEIGDERLRSDVADMWTRLGMDEKASDAWQRLYLANPAVPYYGVEHALALFRMGRGEDAIRALKSVTQMSASPLGFETLSEIQSSLGKYGDSIETVHRGLQSQPTQKLWSYLAYSLEAVGAPPAETRLAAGKALEMDTGSVPMALMFARETASIVSGRTNGVAVPATAPLVGAALSQDGVTNAVTLHQAFLDRNNGFLSSLIFLKDEAILAGRFEEAIRYSELTLAQRPWDLHMLRRYAQALAEKERFRPALQALREVAKADPDSVTPILIYQSLTPYDYAGMNRATVVADAMRQLAALPRALITPDQVGLVTGRVGLVLVFVEPDAAVIDILDPVLKELSGRAVALFAPETLRRDVPYKPTTQRIKDMQRSGRWQIGARLPSQAALPVKADGTLGNPLTHRLYVKGDQESLSAYRKRVSQLVDDALVSVPSWPRLIMYPSGDYGQASLDTDPDTLDALRHIIEARADYAFFLDEAGFLMPDYDPARVPGRVVYPSWSVSNLIAHVRQENPIVGSHVELAKLLYWNGEHQEANHWFRKAQALGVARSELVFNWAANSYMQGDLPTALEQGRQALQYDPTDPKTSNLISRVKDEMRPIAMLSYRAWADSDDYEQRIWHLGAQAQVVERVRAGGFGELVRWQSTATNRYEDGRKLGLQAFMYPYPEVMLDATIWETRMDESSDLFGWDARLSLPHYWSSGSIDLVDTRDQAETLDAMQAGIVEHRHALETYWRMFDTWDLYANPALTERTDDNSTWMLDGRFVKRLTGWPLATAGYAYRFADSDVDVPLYWSPQSLQQHQAYLSYQGSWGPWYAAGSGQAGYSKAAGTDWRFVWGARGNVRYWIHRRISLEGDIAYQESATYDRLSYGLGINARW
jgi:tetratricopeptide (TPR) repeat protein